MTLSQQSRKYSTIALAICYLAMSYTAFIYHPKWKHDGTEATISWDVSGYYMYLPAAFIYKDLKQFSFGDSITAKYQPSPTFGQVNFHEASGNYVLKYSMGQAIVMSPFFAIGHAWACTSSQYEADGFSFPYQISIGIGMFLIAVVGLFFLRLILLHYYKDSTVAIVLLIMAIGTNYLNYSSVDQAMSHNGLFTLYALLVWTTIQFYKKKKATHAVVIGLLCGLAALIRPTEILSIIIPICWRINDKASFKERLLFFKSNYKLLIIATLSGAALIILQPMYWHYATGDWIVYSYLDQGFSWLKPHIWDYTMSYKCGWLRYCPMMVFGIVGYFFYIKKGINKWAILPYLFLAFYITTAWDVWDYGSTAGRAMVQHYVVFAFPMAHLVQWINTKKILRIIFYPIVLLCAYLNIWSIRAGDGNIEISESSCEYYWTVVGRWQVEDETKKLKDNPHLFWGTPKKSSLVYENDLSNDSLEYAFLNHENQFTPGFKFSKPNTKFKWLRASAYFEPIEQEPTNYKFCQFAIDFFNNNERVQTNAIRAQRFVSVGQNKEIYLDAKTPKKWDRAEVKFWNAGSSKEIRMTNLRVIGFDE